MTHGQSRTAPHNRTPRMGWPILSDSRTGCLGKLWSSGFGDPYEQGDQCLHPVVRQCLEHDPLQNCFEMGQISIDGGFSLAGGADAHGIHMGDIEQFGNLVVGVFEKPVIAGSGQYLSLSGDLLSWDDMIATLRVQGHDIAHEQTDEGPYWWRAMLAYFEAHTYFGPNADEKISRARDVITEPMSDFRTWASANMTVGR